MAVDGQVVIEITADNRSAKQTFRDTTNSLNTESGKWEQSGDKFSGMFKKLAAGFSVAKIVSGLVSIGKKAVEAASSLEEVQNVVDVTFGNMSSQIDAWAKNAITQFGLTETQAKQFTSTLGAMMKSSGIADDNIVQMSTDLAGLAADMASFYNLDFDTAFQKIRSGISGETEPLKQLGINMSVANLQAFALTQGITKSFQSMSQGEQTMLRYQYIMQATSDAQGDFARTSDGFANATRKFESELDSLLTKVGGPVMSALSEVLDVANQIVSVLFPNGELKRKTILDEFAEIDADKEAKLAEISATADAARELVNLLDTLSAEGFRVTAVEDFAKGANKLTSSSPANWASLLTAFETNSDGVIRFADDANDPSTNIMNLAQALSGINGAEAKRQAWLTMLGALSANADEIAKYTGQNATDVRSMLDGIASNVTKIDGDDAQAWDDLMTTFATSFPGLITSTTLTALSTSIGGIAQSANGLSASSQSNWATLLGSLKEIDGLENLWGEDNAAAGNISAIAGAMANNGVTPAKANAWSTIINALKENVGTLAEMRGESESETFAWLDNLANAANSLDENAAGEWEALRAELAKGIPALNGQTVSSWTDLIAALGNLDGLENIWGGGGTAQETIQGLADALGSPGITMSRATAWQRIIDALKNNVGTLAEMRGEDEADTWRWLETLANAANELDPDSADAWDTLFGWLVEGIPGLEETEGGKRILEALNGNYGRTTTAGEEAARVMEMLGVSTEGVNDQQALWIATCKELVRLIPSLSKIINTETGEIIGGAQAVREYVDAWEMQSAREIQIKALQQKIDEYNAMLNTARVDTRVKRALVNSYMDNDFDAQDVFSENRDDRNKKYYGQDALDLFEVWLKEFGTTYDPESLFNVGIKGNAARSGQFTVEQAYRLGSMHNLYESLSEVGKQAFEDWVKSTMENAYVEDMVPKVTQGIQSDIDELTAQGVDAMQELADAYGTVGDAANDASRATSDFTEEHTKEWEELIDAANEAALAVIKYSDQVHEQIRSTLHNVAGLFDEVMTSDQRVIRDLQDDLEGLSDEEIEIKIGTSGIRTAQNIIANLESRVRYFQDYNNMINALKERGVDADFLAELSDGSTASYDVLVALSKASDEDLQKIVELYQQAGNEEQSLATTLRENKLAVDDEFRGLVETLNEYFRQMDEMTATDAPALAVGETMQNVIDTINTLQPTLYTKLLRLRGMLNAGDWAGLFSISGGHGGFRISLPSHAEGLDYVPFDGYIAELHEGESVLTAQEAKIWREMNRGVDYSGISGAIWDNAPDLGGNVYLNGEIVGRIMSAAQADSYRQLERSGWRG